MPTASPAFLFDRSFVSIWGMIGLPIILINLGRDFPKPISMPCDTIIKYPLHPREDHCETDDKTLSIWV
jgi:hypothetical protein